MATRQQSSCPIHIITTEEASARVRDTSQTRARRAMFGSNRSARIMPLRFTAGWLHSRTKRVPFDDIVLPTTTTSVVCGLSGRWNLCDWRFSAPGPEVHGLRSSDSFMQGGERANMNGKIRRQFLCRRRFDLVEASYLLQSSFLSSDTGCLRLKKALASRAPRRVRTN
jgi:hypothetical protein